MPSRPACFVLGLGIASILPAVCDVVARLLAGESLIYPKEIP